MTTTTDLTPRAIELLQSIALTAVALQDERAFDADALPDGRSIETALANIDSLLNDMVGCPDDDDEPEPMTLATFRSRATRVTWSEAPEDATQQNVGEGGAWRDRPTHFRIYPGGCWIAEHDAGWSLVLERYDSPITTDLGGLESRLHEWAVRECCLLEDDPDIR